MKYTEMTVENLNHDLVKLLRTGEAIVKVEHRFLDSCSHEDYQKILILLFNAACLSTEGITDTWWRYHFKEDRNDQDSTYVDKCDTLNEITSRKKRKVYLLDEFFTSGETKFTESYQIY